MTAHPNVPVQRLGILAGGGSVPAEIAAAAVAGGCDVHVVGIEGEVDADFGAVPVTVANWGQIGRMINTFKRTARTHVVIIGRVSRPDLTRIRPDWGLVASIPWILKVMASGGDDGVLRTVVRFFEHHGMTIIGPADVAPGLLVRAGPVGAVTLPVRQKDDVAHGLSLIRRLGPFDVGQGLVVTDGTVNVIEGAEGTDRMLARLAAQRVAGAAPQGVLVKRPKPGQEMRVDMPAIGPETVTRVAQAGLSGIAVLAGQVLVTQRSELVRRADADGVAVEGVQEDVPAAASAKWVAPSKLDADDEDIERGIAVLQCLRPDVRSRGIVVARKYVLAIETGEGIDDMLTRVAGLRQWGSARLKKRVGYAVLSGEITVDETIVARAVSGGIRGLALITDASGEPFVTFRAGKQAEAAGLNIQVIDPARSRLS